MRLSRFAPTFEDYELNLDYYHGKDILHEGCMLKIDPEFSWEKITSKIRNKIRLAQKLNTETKRVKGTPEEIKLFRSVWFDEYDDSLPEKLEPDDIMYFMYLDGELAGGLILSPSSPNMLYMHHLGANEAGKRNNIPALLLWHAVEDLKDTKWEYIDVGVSFRQALYSFFKNWQTSSYPIIFAPPFLKPDIRLTPFSGAAIPAYHKDAWREARGITSQYFGNNYTILPRAIHCLMAVLKHLDIKKTDSVAVYKTFDNNDYVTACVTKPIEKFCTATSKIDKNTKAVVIVHEYGFPYAHTLKLKAECEKHGIPLIEDCAWAYGSKIDGKHAIGEVGDYAIYSLPKIMPIPYGAILKGLTISDEENWETYRLLDYYKRELILTELQKHLPKLHEENDRRRENWQYLARHFEQVGYRPTAPLPDDVYPGALLIELDNFNEVFDRFEEFGIETGRYYQGKSIFLPVHQNLTDSQLDYIYGVFRGMLNLNINYRRDEAKK